MNERTRLLPRRDVSGRPPPEPAREPTRPTRPLLVWAVGSCVVVVVVMAAAIAVASQGSQQRFVVPRAMTPETSSTIIVDQVSRIDAILDQWDSWKQAIHAQWQDAESWMGHHKEEASKAWNSTRQAFEQQHPAEWWNRTASQEWFQASRDQLQAFGALTSSWWTNATTAASSTSASAQEQLHAWQQQAAEKEHVAQSKVQDWWNHTLNSTIPHDKEAIQSWEHAAVDKEQTIQSNFQQWYRTAHDEERTWWNHTVAAYRTWQSRAAAPQWWNVTRQSVHNQWNMSQEHTQEWWNATKSWFESHVASIANTTFPERPLLYLNTTSAVVLVTMDREKTVGNVGWIQANEYSHDFFAYQLGWDVQENRAYCAVATVAAVLNSFRQGESTLSVPIDVLYDPFPYATQHDVMTDSHDRGQEVMLASDYAKAMATPQLNTAQGSEKSSNATLLRHHLDANRSNTTEHRSGNTSGTAHRHNKTLEADLPATHSKHRASSIDAKHAQHRRRLKSTKTYDTPYECVNDRVVRYNSSMNGVLSAPGGVSLPQAAELLRCHLPLWNITVTHADPALLNVSTVREQLVSALKNEQARVFVNLDRHVLGQSDHAGAGHFSPLASYSKSQDAFLMLDVAKYRFPPSWISTARLYAAMSTLDSCGDWDFPQAQDLLPPSQALPRTQEAMEEAFTLLNCRPTFRGFVVVQRQ
jgi:Phytochelatin synthase